MMKMSVAALAVGLAGAAHAAPFTLESVSPGCANRCSGVGSPLYTTTSYYQDPFGNNYPPSRAFIAVFPTLAEDSYIAMDPVGPSSSTHTADGPGASEPGHGASSGHFTGGSVLEGGYFRGGGVMSGAADPFGGHGVFFGQVVTDGLLYQGSGGNVHFYVTELGALRLSMNGPAVKGLSFRTYERPSAFGFGTVYELWITDVPAPGGGGVMVVAVIAAGVRRRRVDGARLMSAA